MKFNFSAIAKVVPSVRVKRFDRHLYLRSTYYPPCFGRAGRVYVIPNRHSWFKDGKPLDILGGRLTLGPLTYHDTGVYECFLRTSLGSVTITFNITVKGENLCQMYRRIDELVFTVSSDM